MLELIMLAVLSTQPRIITCTVGKPGVTVVCLEQRGRKQVGTVYRVDRYADEELDKWRWRVQYQGDQPDYNAPLVKVALRKGQQVKGKIVDGWLVPVAACKVRVHQAVNDYARAKGGGPVPLSLHTDPDDCQPWYGKETP